MHYVPPTLASDSIAKVWGAWASLDFGFSYASICVPSLNVIGVYAYVGAHQWNYDYVNYQLNTLPGFASWFAKRNAVDLGPDIRWFEVIHLVNTNRMKCKYDSYMPQSVLSNTKYVFISYDCMNVHVPNEKKGNWIKKERNQRFLNKRYNYVPWFGMWQRWNDYVFVPNPFQEGKWRVLHFPRWSFMPRFISIFEWKYDLCTWSHAPFWFDVASLQIL